jgi:hypothetical protein
LRRAFLLLINIVFLPLCSLAQSTLNFPHVLEPPDFATSGFAVVNPGPTDAKATFTLFGADGSVVSTSSIQMIGARGQLAIVASQLFPPVLAGWVQVTSDTAGLQGFWFAGDLVNFADGAEAAPSGTELVLPMVAPSSEIDIANTVPRGLCDSTWNPLGVRLLILNPPCGGRRFRSGGRFRSGRLT